MIDVCFRGMSGHREWRALSSADGREGSQSGRPIVELRVSMFMAQKRWQLLTGQNAQGLRADLSVHGSKCWMIKDWSIDLSSRDHND
jgi:hypothetical protein